MQNLDIFKNSIKKTIEVGSYEQLWQESGVSFKSIAEKFRKNVNAKPSDFVKSLITAKSNYDEIHQLLKNSAINNLGVKFRNTFDWCNKLNDAKDALELIYYAGNWDLIDEDCISIVGTRNPTPEGVLRAEKLTKALVDKGYTIVSGLARGIDTIAHKTAIENGGKTIAVLGTPLNIVYPSENLELYKKIINNHLLLSQVPFLKYKNQSFDSKRLYFPERNKTMSAISQATIIVEAGETSGTLVQARAALEQGRKLFILANCFDKGLSWPNKYEEKGAIRIRDLNNLWHYLDTN